MSRFKVEFIVTEDLSFEDITNWAWIKKDALKDIFSPYAEVSHFKKSKLKALLTDLPRIFCLSMV